MTGVLVLVGTLVLGVLTGTVLSLRNGRIRRPTMSGMSGMSAVSPSDPAPPPAPVVDVLTPGAVTLVQLSTTFCAPCRHARAVLSRVAESTDGIAHVDLDITDRPGLAEALRVLRTPTTIAFDDEGTELLRISGVPKIATLREALAPHVRLTE
ncbi:TlpA family protein disulfide reductase [Saccharomonospora cyanea]|uniref:Thiol-disulfide isomerase-like thioredoxin n=1 Tax=Saccharomonospora cyanea NA-134 TaxID=882082 RepID=H5XP46_9PSEU|nr:thioredoxin family protein [Saccharomonospora cyanea]EHR63759.1 thiol-disulfide isomerase-like thioredoxin [Saccharomonospora cyanea NA-134]